MNTKIFRTYTELNSMKTFDERFKYLYLGGHVGKETFGFDRWLNQRFYRSQEWKRIRDIVILRDYGCDLGVEGREIYGNPIIHHMNPISEKDLIERSDLLLNPEYLITVSHQTHNALHYGVRDSDIFFSKERTKNDTCPWKQ